MSNEELVRNVQKLKILLSVKNQFEKQLNFQMSMFLKKDKINKIFEDLDYSLFDDGCDLEIDMRRSLSIINNVDCKIHDLLKNYDIDVNDNDKYAKFILKHEYCIE